jgi:ubiquitin C-terminal hydrolase
MPEELRIRSAPEVLFIHIDRNFYGRQKIRDPVDFPNVLELTRYKSGSFNGQDGPLIYAIGAVISHQGGIHGGHYISTTKSPAGTFHANDETVRRAEFIDTKGSPRFHFEPVVLMYLKRQ